MMQWLETTLGGAPESVETLRPEASFREFYRVQRGRTSQVAMYAPPDKEDPERFVRLARMLHNAGVPVPEIHDCDTASGFVLMEDFGSRHFLDLYRTGDFQSALEPGISMLHVLQRIPTDTLPPYTPDRLGDELDIFRTWMIEGLLSRQAPADWLSFRQMLVDGIAAQPVTVIHRDYHCRNLLLTHAGGLGIVDFQDALSGPALYDLASLLRDCYWRFDESIIQRWFARYLAGCPWHFEDPWHEFNRTALQRQLKAVGIFARLHLRDGKSSHLEYIVPVLEHAAFLARESTSYSAVAAWLNELQGAARSRLSELPDRNS